MFLGRMQNKSEVPGFQHIETNLKSFGIELHHLPNCTSKSIDERLCARHIASSICEDEALLGELFSNRNIPTMAIHHFDKNQKKVARRQRKYIIALCVMNQAGFEI